MRTSSSRVPQKRRTSARVLRTLNSALDMRKGLTASSSLARLLLSLIGRGRRAVSEPREAVAGVRPAPRLGDGGHHGSRASSSPLWRLKSHGPRSKVSRRGQCSVWEAMSAVPLIAIARETPWMPSDFCSPYRFRLHVVSPCHR